MRTTYRWARYALAICTAWGWLAGCGATQPLLLAPAARANAQSSAGDLLGCPYPSGDVWQTNISKSGIAPNSAAEIQATIDAGGGGSFRVDAPETDELINPANNSTPLVAVEAKLHDHKPYSPWPWKEDFYIEPLGDAHALVLQSQDCQYYEGYAVSYSSSSGLSMDNGGKWNLAAPFTRPQQGGISTASGIPIGLVAVRPEELVAGVIRHALGWNGVANSWSQTACVSPAGKTDCTDDIPYDGPASQAQNAMPYGAHIRLHASFDDSNFPAAAKVVAKALKKYGAYAYDTGCCNTIPFVNDVNGGPIWTYADTDAIKTITLSDFDVVVAP
jgi:hypothetical protein